MTYNQARRVVLKSAARIKAPTGFQVEVQKAARAVQNLRKLKGDIEVLSRKRKNQSSAFYAPMLFRPYEQRYFWIWKNQVPSYLKKTLIGGRSFIALADTSSDAGLKKSYGAVLRHLANLIRMLEGVGKGKSTKQSRWEFGALSRVRALQKVAGKLDMKLRPGNISEMGFLNSVQNLNQHVQNIDRTFPQLRKFPSWMQLRKHTNPRAIPNRMILTQNVWGRVANRLVKETITALNQQL